MIPAMSLVVSCFNQRACIGHVLASVGAQRVDVPFEVIVCDDGSSDGLLAAIEASPFLCGIDLRYLWQPDRGFRLSRSRNNGLRCAQGDVAVFVDGDSWLSPSFLADHWSAHDGDSILVCGSRHTVVIDEADMASLDASVLARVPLTPQAEYGQQRQWLQSSTPWMACLGGNFSVRRSRAILFDERFESWGSEDRNVAFRLAQAGFQVRLLDAPNVLQLRPPGESLREMSHDDVVSLIGNKRQLDRKYPGGELAVSVDLIRHCRVDSVTQRWSFGELRAEASAAHVFREFEIWEAESRGSSTRSFDTEDALCHRLLENANSSSSISTGM